MTGRFKSRRLQRYRPFDEPEVRRDNPQWHADLQQGPVMARPGPQVATDLSRGHENVSGTLLPGLLPNSVARDGTRTDRRRFRDRKSQTIHRVLGCPDTRRDSHNRIWRPVLYQLSYTPKQLT